MRLHKRAACFLGFSLAWTFAAGPIAFARDAKDDQIREAIEKSLEKEKIESLSVSVSKGTVSLTGTVRNIFVQKKAVQIALDQPEAEDVEADIEIATAESDKELGEEVIKQIRRYTRFTAFDDVSAMIRDGNVGLMGWVTAPYKKTDLEKRMYDVLGIQGFENQIVLLPNSQQDDQLRQTLWDRIYRDPMFEDLASMPVPPIHIIVANARVILTGVVRNQMYATKAMSNVRSTPGVLDVQNKLRIGS